jgi:hypothetical protein
MNLTVRPVTARACARPAPGRPAGYADVMQNNTYIYNFRRSFSVYNVSKSLDLCLDYKIKHDIPYHLELLFLP